DCPARVDHFEREAAQPRLAGVLYAVAVAVVELDAGDGDQVEVAEGDVLNLLVGSDDDVGRIGRGLQPAGQRRFADAIGARRQAAEDVGPVRGGGGRLQDGPVGRVDQLHREAAHAGVAGVVHAVAVEVFKL